MQVLRLPNDHTAGTRSGKLTPAAYIATNDYAVGQIVDAISHSKVWASSAVFITEDDPQGGVDHIDSHRTVLLCLGPWARRNHVSHANTSFPGLLKTIFRLLQLPPLNLFDAAATDLADCFRSESETEVDSRYHVREVDKRLFDPATARQAPEGTPSPRMDDPRDLPQRKKR